MMESIESIVRQLVSPIKRRALLMIGRGILTAIDSSKDIQLCSLSLLADETKDKTEMFQHFGFTSVPPNNSDVIMLSVGGNRDHGVIIGSESRSHRLKGLSKGESALYNINGKYIWLKENNLSALIDKVEIKNDDEELVASLVSTLEAIRDGLVLTAIGPQPFMASSKILIDVELDKLKTFKV